MVEEGGEVRKKEHKKAAVRSGDKCLSKIRRRNRKQVPKGNTASANNNLSVSNNRRRTEKERMFGRETERKANRR